MVINSLPDTRTVTLVTVGFIDGSEYSLTLEAVDTFTRVHDPEGWDIVVAAKPERRHSFKNPRTGKEDVMTISAAPERTIFWNMRNVKYIERNTAEVPAYASRVHADDRRDAGAV